MGWSEVLVRFGGSALIAYHFTVEDTEAQRNEATGQIDLTPKLNFLAPPTLGLRLGPRGLRWLQGPRDQSYLRFWTPATHLCRIFSACSREMEMPRARKLCCISETSI